MLDNEIKRRINAARDVLVGQIPDPKGQVEQITTALVYKFMDDLDRKSEESGGKRSFFVGEYARFAWKKLMDARGGGERRDLYANAVEKMAENKQLPDIFRAMFKGAFLPFRDGRILTLFLKEIDALPYRHSEDLGNAYEHLLSIMGTQGDAGQFRTPRHIIDFIVAVADPQKKERIHDPSCGTAGFLISAFRHIQEANKKNRPGDLLTQSEKKNLPQNLIGRELDPGMTRLSLVNMYLHGIRQPQIREYDTLTYDDLWDERYDVILANPPFMTPRGGILPHGRFAVQAKRSEVLFVDYIAEHLSLRGRAGIIVPEGIIFQSQRAYKELRRRLAEDWGLWAVVSLPAGVFNPYSGVKTSVLFLDKMRAKKAKEILFVKVRADGFGLGAQRRSIAENDLPEAQKILSAWKRGKKLESSEIALYTAKNKIAEDDECNLTAERYRATGGYSRPQFPMVKLVDFCRIHQGGKSGLSGKHFIRKGGYPAYGAGGLNGFLPNHEFDKQGTVLSANGARCGKCFLTEEKWSSLANTMIIFPDERADVKFLYYMLDDESRWIKRGTGQPFIRPIDVREKLIPLPPFAVQEEIVAEVDGYQRVIDGARLAIANWKPTININPDWPTLKLGQMCVFNRGVTYSKKDEVHESGIKILRANNINVKSNKLDFSEIRVISKDVKVNPKQMLRAEDILICTASGSKEHLGKVAYTHKDTEFYFGGFMGCIRASEMINARYLFFNLSSKRFRELIQNKAPGVNIQNLKFSDISDYDIPLPPLDEQQRIVAEVAEEEKAIAACRCLIDSHEQKIRAKIAALWGEK